MAAVSLRRIGRYELICSSGLSDRYDLIVMAAERKVLYHWVERCWHDGSNEKDKYLLLFPLQTSCHNYYQLMENFHPQLFYLAPQRITGQANCGQSPFTFCLQQ